MKPTHHLRVRAGRRGIRGVYPRGLIEAATVYAIAPLALRRIRGVYPRGLIEACRADAERP